MKTKNIFGWLLLVIGLAIILYSLYFANLVFTGKAQAPKFFEMDEEVMIDKIPSSNVDLDKKMEELIASQIQEMIPPKFINQLFNLISLSILITLLIFGGSKISLIGIKLLQRYHD